MSVGIEISFTDPREIYHFYQHSIYAGIYRRLKAKGYSDKEIEEKASEWKPDCAAHDLEMGGSVKPQFADLGDLAGGGQVRTFKSMEEFKAFMEDLSKKMQEPPKDDQNDSK